MTARERLAAWLEADRATFPDGDQRFGDHLAISYEAAPLTRADLEELVEDEQSSDALASLAVEIEEHAGISTRAGQGRDLERIARQIRDVADVLLGGAA
jgi:hypothetical protein